MHLWIGAVGRLKEPFYRMAQAEYGRRLKRYTSLTLVEVPDEPVPPGQKEREQVKIKEGERLQKRIPPHSFKVALAPQGRLFSSEEFAAWFGSLLDAGKAEPAFLLGGTLGLPSFLLEGADLVLSLSPLTFPHQLARVILLEQLYRAFRILRGEPYHY